MHVITLPNGLRVDLGAATISLSSRWTSDDRAKEGLAADIVCASIDAPVIAGNGFTTVETICDTAGGATRRARVVAELIEKAVTRRAELLATMPCEDLTPPPAAPVPAAPTSPAFVYTGERGRDLEDLLDGYDHGTAFYTAPHPGEQQRRNRQGFGAPRHLRRCGAWQRRGGDERAVRLRSLRLRPQAVGAACRRCQGEVRGSWLRVVR